MSPQQKIYYEAIKRFIEQNKRSPSYSEIGKMVGVTSMASVHRMVHRLIRNGYLVHGQGSHHNLWVVPDKLSGFNYCDRQHARIYFTEDVCPLCTEIQKHAPPRHVSVGI
jgi:SOS-response transcriptional repressor LexA